ncbi:MAG: transcriptional repressor NrdR [Clostridiales bacterium]|nr:transcriptional repressor NrdR [Clostridiales bacterium]
MKCPFCGWNESKVVDSRPADDYAVIRRRRECEKCTKRFTTYEKIEEMPLIIVKRDGRREAFQREKIINGLMRSCQKRPISFSRIEEIADSVEKELYNTMDKEIDSKTIGERVMDRLKKLDDVAYVRFASVYKQFKDINTFMEELNKIMKER